ncbi:hypothetical protein PENTCL1PPCAC_1540, partial [Pristionchus entomophagus]
KKTSSSSIASTASSRPALTPLEKAAAGDERITREMRPLASQLDQNQRTALHLLAMNPTKSAEDQFYDCELLIDFGVDANVQDYFGNTALHYACRNGRRCLVKRLLEAGADPTFNNELGMTPLHEAAKHFEDHCIEDLLAHPVYKDKTKLEAVDLKDRTALMLYAACSARSIKGAELLLNAGVDVNYPGDRNLSYRTGSTALHHAAVWNDRNKKMFELLISKNANKDATDDHGATPLYLAVQSGNRMAVDELLKAGASMDHADKNDETPEELAIRREYTDIAKR